MERGKEHRHMLESPKKQGQRILPRLACGKFASYCGIDRSETEVPVPKTGDRASAIVHGRRVGNEGAGADEVV